MSRCENIKPKERQIYYSINKDGKVEKCRCVFDKEDLFNIAHSLCWDTPFIKEEDRNKSKSIILRSIEINKGD